MYSGDKILSFDNIGVPMVATKPMQNNLTLLTVNVNNSERWMKMDEIFTHYVKESVLNTL